MSDLARPAPAGTARSAGNDSLIRGGETVLGTHTVFSPTQLAFAAVASPVLYGLFVFVQTVRYRDYFLPPLCPPSPPDAGPDGTDREAPNIDLAHGSARAPGPPAPQHPADTPDTPGTPDTGTAANGAEHAPPPSAGTATASLGLLAAALVGVVGLAKVESPSIGEAVAAVRPTSAQRLAGALAVTAPVLPRARESGEHQVRTGGGCRDGDVGARPRCRRQS